MKIGWHRIGSSTCTHLFIRDAQSGDWVSVFRSEASVFLRVSVSVCVCVILVAKRTLRTAAWSASERFPVETVPTQCVSMSCLVGWLRERGFGDDNDYCGCTGTCMHRYVWPYDSSIVSKTGEPTRTRSVCVHMCVVLTLETLFSVLAMSDSFHSAVH